MTEIQRIAQAIRDGRGHDGCDTLLDSTNFLLPDLVFDVVMEVLAGDLPLDDQQTLQDSRNEWTSGVSRVIESLADEIESTRRGT